MDNDLSLALNDIVREKLNDIIEEHGLKKISIVLNIPYQKLQNMRNTAKYEFRWNYIIALSEEFNLPLREIVRESRLAYRISKRNNASSLKNT
jgi:hypothetical protein